MTSEAVAVKARRILAEGALLVVRVDGDLAEALVRGDSGIYETRHDPDGWHCSCPARGRCAHALALRLVTTWQRPERAAPGGTVEVHSSGSQIPTLRRLI
jgi:hypothetical protein